MVKRKRCSGAQRQAHHIKWRVGSIDFSLMSLSVTHVSVLHVPDSIELRPTGHTGWVGLGWDPFPPRHVKEPLSMACSALSVRNQADGLHWL